MKLRFFSLVFFLFAFHSTLFASAREFRVKTVKEIGEDPRDMRIREGKNKLWDRLEGFYGLHGIKRQHLILELKFPNSDRTTSIGHVALEFTSERIPVIVDNPHLSNLENAVKFYRYLEKTYNSTTIQFAPSPESDDVITRLNTLAQQTDHALYGLIFEINDDFSPLHRPWFREKFINAFGWLLFMPVVLSGGMRL